MKFKFKIQQKWFFKEVHESGFLKKLKNSCKLLNNIKIYCNLFMNQTLGEHKLNTS